MADATELNQMSAKAPIEESNTAKGDSSMGTWRWDLTTRSVTLSKEWFSMLGYEEHEIEQTGDIWWELMHPDDRRLTRASLKVLLTDPVAEGRAIVFRMRHRDGQWVEVLCRGKQTRNADGRATAMEGTMVDLSAIADAQEQLQVAVASAERARMLLESAGRLARLGRWEVHLDGRPPEWSPMMFEIHEVSPDEVVTFELTNSFYDPEWTDRVNQAVHRGMAHLEPFEFEVPITTRKGNRRWVSTRGEPVTDSNGNVVTLRGALRDITEELTLRRQLEDQANVDGLTRLLNRACFMQTVQADLARLGESNQSAAMLMIDLNQFKEINDTMGHDAGDRFLQEVAERLRTIVGADDVLARLGGDEFAVFSHAQPVAESADRLAKALGAGLRQPFWPEGVQYFCSGSIGVATFPAHGATPQELLRHADIAMYAAKEDHTQGVRHYHPSMKRKATDQLERRAQLERAVREEQFELHYQPRVGVVSMRTVAVEALTRWRDQSGTPIPPEAFITLAERTGLIHPIGRWVIERAIQDAASLTRAGRTDVTVAINLSPRQFRHPALVDMIEESLQRWELPGTAIEVEITESLLMEDNHLTQPHLNRLNQLGVPIALDDFGTGYSSFAYLQELQVQTIKLDRRFVTGVETNPRNARLVEAMLSMAKSLGLRTVAEGVETLGTLEFLRERGCDEFQGFLVSPAVALADIAPLLGTFLLELRPGHVADARSVLGRSPSE